MFDQHTKDEYRKIHAPQSLKELVIEKQMKKQKRNILPKMILCTSFAVFCFMFIQPSTSITMCGQVIKDKPILLSSTQVRTISVDDIEIDFEVTSKDETQIRINHGMIDNEKEIKKDGSFSFVWQLSYDDLYNTPTMEKTSQNKTEVYDILFDKEYHAWTLQKRKGD